MGKSRKRRKAGLINNLKTERMQALARAQLDSENECNDNYEPPAKQERRFENQSSVFLMVISVLNSILKDWTICRECREGYLQCDVTSYSCMNTNLIFECNHCRIKRKKWSGPTNISQAALMAIKYAGIKLKQLQRWATCMNFGFKNNQGKQFTVNLIEAKTAKINEDVNIKLDKMKTADEALICQQLLAQKDTEQVQLAIDGMYPVRNDSGICVSSVMATVNGTKKIIGKSYKNTLFHKNTL